MKKLIFIFLFAFTLSANAQPWKTILGDLRIVNKTDTLFIRSLTDYWRIYTGSNKLTLFIDSIHFQDNSVLHSVALLSNDSINTTAIQVNRLWGTETTTLSGNFYNTIGNQQLFNTSNYDGSYLSLFGKMQGFVDDNSFITTGHGSYFGTYLYNVGPYTGYFSGYEQWDSGNIVKDKGFVATTDNVKMMFVDDTLGINSKITFDVDQFRLFMGSFTNSIISAYQTSEIFRITQGVFASQDSYSTDNMTIDSTGVHMTGYSSKTFTNMSVAFIAQNADSTVDFTGNDATLTGNLSVTGNITQNIIIYTLTDDTPTDAEITAAIGLTAVQAGRGATYIIEDADESGLIYDVISNGSKWSYIKRTDAL